MLCTHGGVLVGSPLFGSLRRHGSSLRQLRGIRATETDKGKAREAVDAGLVALEKQSDPQQALELFQRALKSNPTDKEACAAAYNIACCYVEMKEWQKAADQLVVAVNDYRLDPEIPRKVGRCYSPGRRSSCLRIQIWTF